MRAVLELNALIPSTEMTVIPNLHHHLVVIILLMDTAIKDARKMLLVSAYQYQDDEGRFRHLSKDEYIL